MNNTCIFHLLPTPLAVGTPVIPQMTMMFRASWLMLLVASCSSLRLSGRGAQLRLFSMNADSNEGKVILNKYSRTITEPPSQGASQAMLYATGLTPEKITLPQVRIMKRSAWIYNGSSLFSCQLGWYMFCMVRRQSMQHASYGPVLLSERRSAGCRPCRLSIQYHWRVRWNQYGHGRDVFFLAITRCYC